MKRKAMISIEASLIIPLVFLIILVFIDLAYLGYAKTSTKSKMELSILNSREKISTMKNSKFNGNTENPHSIDEFLDRKLERSILDEINVSLDAYNIKNETEKELIASLPEKITKYKSLNAKINKKVFFSDFELNYSYRFKTILSNFYENLNIKIDSMQGKTKLNEHRIFDEIVSVDIVYKILDDKVEFTEYLINFNKGIEKMK